MKNYFDELVSENKKYFEHTSEGADDMPCLLYTSDAADERSSVDLGGRRIIKKKKTMSLAYCSEH